MDLDELRAFALDLVDDGDRIALGHFGDSVPAEAKGDGSPVTRADREIEALLRRRIGEAWPDHAVFGEEGGGRLDPDRPTWVLDPIDGTANFLRGIPVFATLVGVVVDGRPVVGVASAPALGERWDAVAGAGARRNGRPATVSTVADLGEAQVLHGGLDWYRRSPAAWELLGRLADAAWRTRGFGDFWMHLLVAGGMAEVAVERDLKPWDIAAVECIVTEAGGRMTSFDGGPAMTTGEVLSTNGVLHERVLGLLAQADVTRGHA